LTSDAPRPERLFIGVPVTTDARDAISRALPKNLPGKLVAPDKWHFTLRFLGATESEPRDKIVAGLSTARLGSPFQIRFGQLGAFPKPGRARVLWLGLTKGAERLCELAAIAEDVARSAGFTAEARAFKPHLTLSRIDPPVSVAALLDQHHRYDFASTVTAVILYRSKLGGGPAKYEEVARFAL
jgi:2'-5' RNA ligase